LLSGFEFEKQMYMTKEQLSNMAAEAYNRLGKNPPPYQWMDGFVAGYVECQKNLQQCNVSGALPNAEDVKRWYQLLVGKSEIDMQKDIEATLR
jgi:hypothetical protein